MKSVFFGDIRTKLVEHLDEANDSIKIAMAWFTNEVLFQVVRNKAAAKVKIEVILSDSEANFRPEYSLDFAALGRKGANVYVMQSGASYNFMHHKFAVIDGKKVITGSYNWSSSANTNFENIVVLDDLETAKIFSIQFNSLLTHESLLTYEEFDKSSQLRTADNIEDNDTTRFALAREFNNSIDDAMKEAATLDIMLNMNIIDDLIRRYTAVGAAIKLSNDPEQSGFRKLVAIRREDLTFEYHTALRRFAPLFDKKTIRNAKEKLRPYLRNKVDEL